VSEIGRGGKRVRVEHLGHLQQYLCVENLHALSNTYHAISLSDFGELDSLLGTLYAEACINLLRQSDIFGCHFIVFFAQAEFY
jgi:hypothetical protein